MQPTLSSSLVSSGVVGCGDWDAGRNAVLHRLDLWACPIVPRLQMRILDAHSVTDPVEYKTTLTRFLFTNPTDSVIRSDAGHMTYFFESS